MSACNRLDLQTLGSQPVMPKNLPDHWVEPRVELYYSNTSLHKVRMPESGWEAGDNKWGWWGRGTKPTSGCMSPLQVVRKHFKFEYVDAKNPTIEHFIFYINIGST